MSRIKPRASYGQHFLINKRYAERIVEALDPKMGESVVEIGPGKGVLTDFLVNRGCRVIAIELDRQLSGLLDGLYGHDKNFMLLILDFLKLDPAQIPKNSKLIGNIPYNITTPILDKIFDLRDNITLAVLTVQAEVAVKLTAKPRMPGYGRSTISLWSGFVVEPLFTIPRKAFSPSPDVTSKVIRIRPAERGIEDIEDFRQFIRGCFYQKTKTLANSMQLGFDWPKEKCEYLIREADLDIKVRPSAVTCEEYLKLYRIWQNTR